jgi:hypothetical protein
MDARDKILPALRSVRRYVVELYNTIRPHASLNYRPPASEFFVPAFAAWPTPQSRPAPPAMLAQGLLGRRHVSTGIRICSYDRALRFRVYCSTRCRIPERSGSCSERIVRQHSRRHQGVHLAVFVPFSFAGGTEGLPVLRPKTPKITAAFLVSHTGSRRGKRSAASGYAPSIDECFCALRRPERAVGQRIKAWHWSLDR